MNAPVPSTQQQIVGSTPASLLTRVALTVIGALALLWPAYVNGGPFWFPDTSNYIRAADAAVVALTGSASEWSDRLEYVAPPAAQQAGQPQAGTGAIQPTRPVLAGRSIYYGFLVYLPMRFAGPWGAAILQALLVAGVLLYCCRILLGATGGVSQRLLVVGTGVLLFATPLPYYTAMLMPDVYTGLLILVLAIAIALWSRLTQSQRLTLLVIAAAICTFHTTHLLIAAGMAVAAAVFKLGGQRLRPLLIALPVLAVGVFSIVAFSLAVKAALGQPPISPPFLSARLTAAGPGTEFLKAECLKQPDAWALCAHLNKLPQWSDDFLWSEDARSGVFQVSGNAEKRRLASEDKRFALAVLLAHPGDVVGVSLANFGRQLVSFRMGGFNAPPAQAARLRTKYPPSVAAAIERTSGARGQFNLQPVRMLTMACFVVSLALLAFTARKSFLRTMDHRRLVWHVVFLICLGIVANAAITGALSNPHGRYQMRLIWLLPLAAGIAWAMARPHLNLVFRRAAHSPG